MCSLKPLNHVPDNNQRLQTFPFVIHILFMHVQMYPRIMPVCMQLLGRISVACVCVCVCKTCIHGMYVEQILPDGIPACNFMHSYLCALCKPCSERLCYWVANVLMCIDSGLLRIHPKNIWKLDSTSNSCFKANFVCKRRKPSSICLAGRYFGCFHKKICIDLNEESMLFLRWYMQDLCLWVCISFNCLTWMHFCAHI
jgi:hypothetical protein